MAQTNVIPIGRAEELRAKKRPGQVLPREIDRGSGKILRRTYEEQRQIDDLRGDYVALRIAADYSPERLKAKATHALYMHSVIAGQCGLEDPEDLYVSEDPAHLESLRAVIPYWFE